MSMAPGLLAAAKQMCVPACPSTHLNSCPSLLRGSAHYRCYHSIFAPGGHCLGLGMLSCMGNNVTLILFNRQEMLSLAMVPGLHQDIL